MKNTEQLTIAGYKLYRDLREVGHNTFSKTALKLAFEMHEIKKIINEFMQGFPS